MRIGRAEVEKPVNPLKRLKLKSQLRNCDYVLAGTVIKQQYYDHAKPTVINRLIDEFMANPNFDNALKLIEYNEMLTFYFTESCAGGLYVRKSGQDGPAAPPREPSGEDGASSPEEDGMGAASPADEPAFAFPGIDEPAGTETGLRREEREEDAAGPMPLLPRTDAGASGDSAGEAGARAASEHEASDASDAAEPAGGAGTGAAEADGSPDFAAPSEPDDPSAGPDPLADDPKRRRRRQKQQQILQESEALMQQLLSLDPRRRKAARSEEAGEPAGAGRDGSPAAGPAATGPEADADLDATRQYRVGEWSDPTAAATAEPDAPAFLKEIGREAAPALEPDFGRSRLASRPDDDVPADGRLADDALPEAEPARPKPAWTRKPYARDADNAAAGPDAGIRADDAFGGAMADGREAGARSRSESSGALSRDAARAAGPPAEPPAHRLPKRSYANVINTLKIDIHTMAKQLEEYRRELSHNPPNEQQLIAWINALEDAIEEFSQVVDYLEDHQ